MVVDAAKPCHLASEVLWWAIGILGHLLAVAHKPRICAEICHSLHLDNVRPIHGHAVDTSAGSIQHSESGKRQRISKTVGH